MIFLYLVVISLLGYAAFNTLTNTIYRKTTISVIKHVRWWMVPGALLTFAVVLGSSYVLSEVPYLDFGLLKLLSGGENTGNVALGPSVLDVNLLSPEVALVFLFPLLLLVNVPRFAFNEEVIFRLDSDKRSWPQRVVAALKFGLIHMIMGIPLFVALSLTFAGMYFTLVFLHFHRRSLTLQSERGVEFRKSGITPLEAMKNDSMIPEVNASLYAGAAHAVYNALLITFILVVSTLYVALQ